ncbi:Met-10+ like-protein-domain-containing protein [Lyophyllum atratum]|nr:Met-10+ like-protein-domain-containing protein [Lyophyllum atratum]
MSRQLSLDATPPDYHGFPLLGTFNRKAFTKSFEILAAQAPAAKTGSILKAPQMRGSLLNLQKLRSVEVDPSDPANGRLVLLRVTDEAQLSPEASKFLETEAKGLVPYTLTLDYDYWTADEILRAVLPEGLRKEAPSGFATTGHIAHLNLNAEYLPYKRLIGQIILDKNKKIRTVVNKLDSIDSQFRFFKMELIAGDPDFVVEHHELECKFVFDFREVYWNSRLHTEHGRLVDMFKHDDVIADVFAGVGPFAVPAARKGCAVFANDLNPNSAKYLTTNVQNNRVGDLVNISCEDGREFIRSVFRRSFEKPFPGSYGPPLSKTQENLAQRQRKKEARISLPSGDAPTVPPPRRRISHFVMNLPDSAITFLDAFRGVLASDAEGLHEVYDVTPMVHCHCFTRELEPDKAEADIRQLGAALTTDVSLHLVRSVAPGKEMYCISFRLPSEVLLSTSE